MIAVIIIAVLACILDQVSKIIVSHNLPLQEPKVLIEKFFYFTYCRNDGIAWGMDVPLIVLILITIVAIAAFVYFSSKLKWKKDKWLCITVGFMFGGCIGNFIDRIFQADHSVVDFLDFLIYYPSFKGGFHFEPYDFPIFNIADCFLVIGAVMFIIYVLFIEPKKAKAEKELSDKNEANNDEVINV